MTTPSTNAFFAEHFVSKGGEVAQACLRTLHSLQNLLAVAR